MKLRIRHIVAALLLAIFLVKGMAAIASIFSVQLKGQVLVELVHSAEQEENKSIPESKHEGEPNEYFITHTFGTVPISFLSNSQNDLARHSSAEQPGFGSVPTPPPDQA